MILLLRRPREDGTGANAIGAEEGNGAFAMATPSSIRTGARGYYTKAYAKKHGLKYRSQVDLVVEMLSQLHAPENVRVIVLADSFFEDKKLDQICSKRHFTWVTAVDGHRCLADEKGTSNGQHIVPL